VAPIDSLTLSKQLWMPSECIVSQNDLNLGIDRNHTLFTISLDPFGVKRTQQWGGAFSPEQKQLPQVPQSSHLSQQGSGSPQFGDQSSPQIPVHLAPLVSSTYNYQLLTRSKVYQHLSFPLFSTKKIDQNFTSSFQSAQQQSSQQASIQSSTKKISLNTPTTSTLMNSYQDHYNFLTKNYLFSLGLNERPEPMPKKLSFSSENPHIELTHPSPSIGSNGLSSNAQMRSSDAFSNSSTVAPLDVAQMGALHFYNSHNIYGPGDHLANSRDSFDLLSNSGRDGKKIDFNLQTFIETMVAFSPYIPYDQTPEAPTHPEDLDIYDELNSIGYPQYGCNNANFNKNNTFSAAFASNPLSFIDGINEHRYINPFNVNKNALESNLIQRFNIDMKHGFSDQTSLYHQYLPPTLRPTNTLSHTSPNGSSNAVPARYGNHGLISTLMYANNNHNPPFTMNNDQTAPSNSFISNLGTPQPLQISPSIDTNLPKPQTTFGPTNNPVLTTLQPHSRRSDQYQLPELKRAQHIDNKQFNWDAIGSSRERYFVYRREFVTEDMDMQSILMKNQLYEQYETQQRRLKELTMGHEHNMTFGAQIEKSGKEKKSKDKKEVYQFPTEWLNLTPNTLPSIQPIIYKIVQPNDVLLLRQPVAPHVLWLILSHISTPHYIDIEYILHSTAVHIQGCQIPSLYRQNGNKPLHSPYSTKRTKSIKDHSGFNKSTTKDHTVSKDPNTAIDGTYLAEQRALLQAHHKQLAASHSQEDVKSLPHNGYCNCLDWFLVIHTLDMAKIY